MHNFALKLYPETPEDPWQETTGLFGGDFPRYRARNEIYFDQTGLRYNFLSDDLLERTFRQAEGEVDKLSSDTVRKPVSRRGDFTARISSRLTYLRKEAEADGDEFNEASADFMSSFANLNSMPFPNLVITAKGNVRAIWTKADFSIELEFFGDRTIGFVVSIFRNRLQPGRYAGWDKESAIIHRWADLIGELRSKV